MKKIEPQGFWEWAFSDFLSNAQRGVLAEYIVASSVGCTHKPRTEWDAYDLETDDGLKIEVKSSAYLQSWAQKKPSVIRFDIGRKRILDAETNTYSVDAIRPADVYVFCVFEEKDRAIADPLDLSQWSFLVVSTPFLNDKFENQKSVSLSTLEENGLSRSQYDELAAAIEAQTSFASPSVTAT